MAIRGAVAKEIATKKIVETFGDKCLGVADNKKIYVDVYEGSEPITLCLAITTANKIPEGLKKSAPALTNDSDTSVPTARVEISDEDSAKIDKLMEKLGLK